MARVSNSLVNPKRRHGTFLLHDFYAGYNPAFVGSVLDLFDLPSESVVFDPWNGSGTTTRVASQHGFEAIGFDINPTMIVIARATCADKNTFSESVPSLVETILHSKPHVSGVSQHTFPLVGKKLKTLASEPLELWFSAPTARLLRTLEKRLFLCLASSSHNLQDLSPLAAFFYVAFFNTVRTLVNPFCGSNPTWVKIAKCPRRRSEFSGACALFQ